MAITITHQIEAVGEGQFITQALYDYMDSLPARFTIIDESGIGTEGGWFVFELNGGTGWQCWVGGRDAAFVEPAWLNSNMYNGLTPPVYTMSMAFSPRGGWDAASDAPSGTMFSNAPAEGAGAAGQYWLRIRETEPAIYFVAGQLQWLTVWDDPDEGFFAVLVDQNRNNSWDSGFGIFPMDSRFPSGDDPVPYVVLAGDPEVGSSNDWLRSSTADSNWSAMLRPGDTGSPPVNCYPRHEPFRVLDSDTQPDPINGNYDLDAVGIFTKSAGAGHSRGFIKPAYLRQSKAVGSARDTYNSGAWVLMRTNGVICLPWDGSPI